MFTAKAVVLATGGIGRAYKITSNSWEVHRRRPRARLRRRRRAAWTWSSSSSIRPAWSGRRACSGILVTEGVRGEGGVLRNSEGRRFMFDDIPENYRAQTADNEEEGWRYTQGDKSARRPPELLTRDHVARCIMREVKAGRGSPHGGVFLDIAWIKEKLPERAPSTSRRSCRACTTSSSSWPTSTSPRSRWRSARRRTTSWAASGWTPTRRCRRVPGLFAAGECAAGINGANRLGGNSLSDLLVFGKRAGEYAAEVRASEHGARAIDERAGRRRRCSDALEPFERGDARREPVQGAARAAGDDAGPRRHRPHRGEMQRALDGLARAEASAPRRSASTGHREYNPGWHTALDLRQPADRVGGDHALGDRAQGEPRRPLPRGLSRTRTQAFAHVQHRRAQGRRTGRCRSRACRFRRCRPSCKQIIEENSRRRMTTWRRRRSESGAATASGGAFRDYPTEVTEGMVVLDAVHQIQAEQAHDLAVRWNCKAGKCGSCSAEINGKPRLMCMTRLNTLDLDEPVTVEPMRAFPLIQDLVTDVSWNYRVKKRIKPFKPRHARRAGRHLADAAGRRRPRAGVPQVHRVLPVPGRLPRAARSRHARGVHRPALPASTPRRSRCTRSTPRTASPS